MNGRLAKVWARVKADSDAKSAVCVQLQAEKSAMQEFVPTDADKAALEEMEAAFPEADEAK